MRVINEIICVAGGGGESVMLMRCGKLNRFATGFCYKGKPVTLTLHNQILVTIVASIAYKSRYCIADSFQVLMTEKTQ